MQDRKTGEMIGCGMEEELSPMSLDEGFCPLGIKIPTSV